MTLTFIGVGALTSSGNKFSTQVSLKIEWSWSLSTCLWEKSQMKNSWIPSTSGGDFFIRTLLQKALIKNEHMSNEPAKLQRILERLVWNMTSEEHKNHEKPFHFKKKTFKLINYLWNFHFWSWTTPTKTPMTSRFPSDSISIILIVVGEGGVLPMNWPWVPPKRLQSLVEIAQVFFVWFSDYTHPYL